jgi:hypothetical protein
MTELNYEEAKAAYAGLRPGEIQKFKNVQTAWLKAKAECAEGEVPTQESVRQNLSGHSIGTLLKYLPIVRGLEAGEDNQEFKTDDTTGFDHVIVAGTLKLNAAIAAFVADINAQVHKSTAADNVRLSSSIIAHNAFLQEEIIRREQAEANVKELAAECEQRGAEIDTLQTAHAELLASHAALAHKLSDVSRELDLEQGKNRALQDQVGILDATAIGLRRDADNFRDERELNSQRVGKVEEGIAALEALRVEDAANHRQQLDELRANHAAEIADIGNRYAAEIIGIRTACAREIKEERDRNAALGLALVGALKAHGDQIARSEGDAA